MFRLINSKGKLHNNCAIGIPECLVNKECLYTLYYIHNRKVRLWMSGMAKGSVDLAFRGTGKVIIWLS